MFHFWCNEDGLESNPWPSEQTVRALVHSNLEVHSSPSINNIYRQCTTAISTKRIWPEKPVTKQQIILLPIAWRLQLATSIEKFRWTHMKSNVQGKGIGGIWDSTLDFLIVRKPGWPLKQDNGLRGPDPLKNFHRSLATRLYNQLMGLHQL